MKTEIQIINTMVFGEKILPLTSEMTTHCIYHVTLVSHCCAGQYNIIFSVNIMISYYNAIFRIMYNWVTCR